MTDVITQGIDFAPQWLQSHLRKYGIPISCVKGKSLWALHGGELRLA